MKLESDEEIDQDERRNPVKRAEREKEFRECGKLKDIYTTAQDIYEQLLKHNKTIKTVKNNHPKNKDLAIIDFSLAARGPQEDEVYSLHPYYRNNVRRGNTVVVNSKTKEVFWGRKGLIKFFDISDKSLRAIVEEDEKSIDKRYRAVHQAVFSEIENVLSCNEELPLEHQAKVHVFRLNKANGENAQVSYFPPTDEWVVSSKNVAVFIKEPLDLKLYQGQRYSFSILIAQAWFGLLEGKTKDEIQELKQDLTNRAIVGEYCGNPDFQHLVKYSEITIFFYALVELQSVYSCLPPPEAFRLLQKHKLPIVKNHENSLFGKFTNYKEFGQNMLGLFKTVATSSIFEDEEGSVIYFVLEKPKEFCEYVSDRVLQGSVPIPLDWAEKDVHFNVCSLGKLKTLQYRILRKLREKLKFFTRLKKKEENKEGKENDQKKMEEKYGSFEKEVFSLVKGAELTKPLEYFFCAAIVAFDYTYTHRKNQRNLALLSEHYLDFLSIIFWSMENRKAVIPAMMNDDQLIQQLRKTNWDKYSTDIIQEYPAMLQKLAPRYAKIKKTLGLAEQEGEEQEPEGDDN